MKRFGPVHCQSYPDFGDLDLDLRSENILTKESSLGNRNLLSWLQLLRNTPENEAIYHGCTHLTLN